MIWVAGMIKRNPRNRSHLLVWFERQSGAWDQGSKGAGKIKIQVAADSPKMDSLLGELSKVRKFVSNFTDAQSGNSERDE